MSSTSPRSPRMLGLCFRTRFEIQKYVPLFWADLLLILVIQQIFPVSHPVLHKANALLHRQGVFASSTGSIDRGAFNSDMCGTWHGDYTRLHARLRQESKQRAKAEEQAELAEEGEEQAGGRGFVEIEKGADTALDKLVGVAGSQSGARFATYLCDRRDCGGLGDVLLGVVSTFVVALAEGRAFIIDYPLLEHAFEPAMIDWRPSEDVPTERTRLHAPGVPVQAGDVLYIKLVDSVPADLEGYFKDLDEAANLRIKWNRGILTRIFEGEGEWKNFLFDGGLRLPYAFGCILRYLLRPKPEIRRLVEEHLRRLEAPGVNSICIHVRTPDEMTWHGDGRRIEANESRSKELWEWTKSKILDCAQKVEDFWCPAADSTLWVFLSNSQSIKSLVQAEYKEKVLVTNIAPEHSVFFRDAARKIESWKTSAAEWLLLSHCTFFVITESGFSKTAAMYSLRPLSTFLLSRLKYKSKRNEWVDVCDPTTPTSFSLLGGRWSGI